MLLMFRLRTLGNKDGVKLVKEGWSRQTNVEGKRKTKKNSRGRSRAFQDSSRFAGISVTGGRSWEVE